MGESAELSLGFETRGASSLVLGVAVELRVGVAESCTVWGNGEPHHWNNRSGGQKRSESLHRKRGKRSNAMARLRWPDPIALCVKTWRNEPFERTPGPLGRHVDRWALEEGRSQATASLAAL